jgi:GntR family transcriptional regulator, transcriptional repressor for pyruvate dehydrogenase complex
MTGQTTARFPLDRDGVARRLEQDLLDGTIAPGEKLPSERELAARFGVSRPLVREALRGLIEKGYIEVSPGRGAFARQVRARDAARPLDILLRRQRVTPRDIVEARMMVERDAAYLAAERATDDDLEALRRALAGFASANGIIERATWDVAFHALISRAARNPVIETMFGSIVGLTFELVVRSLGDPGVSREGVPYHDEILDALVHRDPARARRAVEGHLLVAGRMYGNDLDRSLDAVAREGLERALGEEVPAFSLGDPAQIDAAVDAAVAAALRARSAKA